MKHLFSLVLAFMAVAISAYPYHQMLRIQKDIQIVQKEEGYQSQLPEVYGVRPCGGHSKIVSMHLDGCTPDSICRLPGDGQLRASELEFIPNQDADALGIKLNMLVEEGSKKVYERAIPNSAVQGGHNYIVSAQGAVTEELKGKTVTFQYIIYRVDDNDVETCAEIDFEIY